MRAGVYLKPALVQCAHAAVKSDKSPYYKKKCESLVKRRGKKRAIIAIVYLRQLIQVRQFMAFLYFLSHYLSFYSKILPSNEIVTICQGMNFPLACNAFLAANSSPPQQGTSMRTTVTL